MNTYGQFALASGLAVMAVGILALSAFEVLQFRRRVLGVSGRQLAIRLLGGVLLVAMLMKMAVGIISPGVGLPGNAEYVRASLNFWAECVVLGWLVVLIAAIDLRYVLKYRQRQREYKGEITAELVEQIEAQRNKRTIDPREAISD